MRNALERIYLPLEPVFTEIRKHRTISSTSPEGKKDLRQIKTVDEFIPVEEREDLTKEDKIKAKYHYNKRMYKSSVNEAQ